MRGHHVGDLVILEEAAERWSTDVAMADLVVLVSREIDREAATSSVL